MDYDEHFLTALMLLIGSQDDPLDHGGRLYEREMGEDGSDPVEWLRGQRDG